MRPPWLVSGDVTLMSVININPDSFSDPRCETDLSERIAVAQESVAAGARIVDLGAQSAAVEARIVPPSEQAALLVPIVAALHEVGVPVSVDTYEPDVAESVLAAGADVVNDFSGRLSPELVEVVTDSDALYVLTHNPKGPRRRQMDPWFYDDVMSAVLRYFDEQLAYLEHLGLSRERVILDPGIDAGKTPSQTLALLRDRFRIREAFELPILWAISRKDIIGVLTGRQPVERDAGTLALLDSVAEISDSIVRVHAIAAAYDFMTIKAALGGGLTIPPGKMLAEDLRRQPGVPEEPSA